MTEDKTAARVRALLAKAESTDSLQEQAALIAKATELTVKYSIDAARLQAAGGVPAEDVTTARVEVARYRQPGGKALVSLLLAAAYANQVEVVVHVGYDTSATVVGFPAEIRAAQVLFTSLRRQLEHATDYALRRCKPPGVHGLTYRVSYMHGWVSIIADRLSEARGKAVAQAAAEDTGPASTELVLRSRGERVQERKRELFPKLGTLRNSYRPAASGYRQGRADGKHAALGGDLPAAGAPRRALA